MPGLETDDALGWLARGETALGRLHSVVDRVAQEVAKRRIEGSQDVAVHARRLARDVEPYGLAQRLAQVAHHARERLNAVREGTHPAGDRFVVESLRQACGATIELLDFGETLCEQAFALDDQFVGASKRGPGRLIQAPPC